MNYIIYDLEFNQIMTDSTEGAGGSSLPFEIIQLGALKLNERLEIVSTFNTFVKPSVHTKIHPFTESLTGINNGKVDFQKSFPQIYEDFLSFTGNEEVILCVWGTVDIRELLRNIKYHQLPPLNFKLFIDVQRYASRHFNCNKGTRIGLKNAVEAFNIPTKADFHDAYNDAFYTAEIFKAIYDESVVPKVYNPGGSYKRPARLKEFVDETALFRQFEKMYQRKLTDDEMTMIKLAYIMGKTRQFIISKNPQ